MFQSARLRLTAWYVTIMLSLSILVSVFVYAAINEELTRIEYIQQSIEINGRLPASVSTPRGPMRVRIMPLDTTEIRWRIISFMIMINLGLAVFVGLLSYFLAGKTLQPIQNMVDAQKRFIADASHELRTPLTSIKTASEVTLRDKNMTLTQAKSLIKENLEEIDHLQALSDNLIKLSAWETLHQKAEFTKLELAKIIAAAKKKVALLAKVKNIAIRSEKTTAQVTGDFASLTELFVILLDNAIKYSPVNSKISITINEQKKNYTLSISDQGVGISENDQQHIFDRFFRVDSSRSSNNGYGLGLAIAKKIVEEHSGSIQVSNNQPKGAIFSISLPK